MANGKQLAEANYATFQTWSAAKFDDDFRAMAKRGAKECGFGKSALDQNARVKNALPQLEDGLRLRGVLPQAVQFDSEA